MVSKGDIVLYHAPRMGFLPAMVTSIHPTKKDDENPPIALTYFVTGYHFPCQAVPRVEYGRKEGRYILKGEPEKEPELVTDEEPVENKEAGKPKQKASAAKE